MKEVLPTRRLGGFRGKRGYLKRARRSLELADALRQPVVLDGAQAATSVSAGTDAEPGVPRLPRQTMLDIHMHSEAAIVFAALAVEAFLNLYGVIRLGEGFYVRHFERLSISAKVAAIVASCTGQILEDTDEILIAANRLRSIRNDLAHPKVTEIREGRSSKIITPPYQQAKAAIADAEIIFARFVVLDSDAEDLIIGA
jgi:hypothetical protein